MYAWQKDDRKICLKDYSNAGQGEVSTKSLARRGTVIDWEALTAFAYGSAWPRSEYAESRGVRYEKTGKKWAASAEGCPCRR